MAPAPLLADLRQQQPVVGVVVHRIDRRGIDDEERRGIVAVEEARIRLGEFLEIAALDMLLIADAALGDAVHQHIDRRLQIHHQVGLGRIHHHPLVDPLVERIFRIVERHAREQPILFEQIVRDAHRAEQILLPNLFELARALEQEEQLGLKRRRARILVEALEEGILIRLLQHELTAQGLRQQPREAGLAHAYRPLDDDESVRVSRSLTMPCSLQK